MLSSDIEYVLSHSEPYQYIGLRVDSIERTKFPMFVQTFNDMIKTGSIPSSSEFVSTYIGNNIDKISNKIKSKESVDGLMARLNRTYPSIMRELHLFLLMREDGGLSSVGAIVDRNIELDKDGIDIQVTIKDKIFAIRIYQGTQRSVAWRKLKDSKKGAQDKLSNKIVIDAILNKENTRLVNGYWLFSNEYANTLIERILNDR
jgi:hypothetical protein